jgi:hypothetical protein
MATSPPSTNVVGLVMVMTGAMVSVTATMTETYFEPKLPPG